MAVLCVLSSYLLLWRPGSGESLQARIITADREFARLALDQPQFLEVPGPAGITLVEVREGAVRCVNSPGIQGICQRSGWLREPGDTAISLPNRIIIEIISTEHAFDSIHF
ncbi:NusG domain II-containing protein [Thiorhodospira sibirica]|uniref:NusG domain II-containing protein n=1 Tax=Thiorhodospira sibirica TaxID=154347 RepID=UPI00022C403B|nr:NusG domain II-containing protein [Thiorhodospira sibirica]